MQIFLKNICIKKNTSYNNSIYTFLKGKTNGT